MMWTAFEGGLTAISASDLPLKNNARLTGLWEVGGQ